MKNKIDQVYSEVKKWIEDIGNDYKSLYICEDISLNLYKKLTEENLKDYEEKFGMKPKLLNAINDNEDEREYYYYNVDHYILEKLKNDIKEFLEKENIIVKYVMICSELYIYTYSELSKDEIDKINNEFNVKYKRFTKTYDDIFGYYFTFY